MDTREKIVTITETPRIVEKLRRRGHHAILVSGFFDVLTADHVRSLRALGSCRRKVALIVALVPPPEPLLPPRARAELVAALGMVDYVTLIDSDKIETELEQIHADEIVHEETADLARLRALIEHVQLRQGS